MGMASINCPSSVLRQSGHRWQCKQVVSKLIPGRMLRTNKSPYWFDKRVVIHPVHMSLRAGVDALRLFCTCLWLFWATWESWYSQITIQDLSISAINPTHCVGRVAINPGCGEDSVTAEQWAKDNRQRTGPALPRGLRLQPRIHKPSTKYRRTDCKLTEQVSLNTNKYF